jgi:hypothetical protein
MNKESLKWLKYPDNKPTKVGYHACWSIAEDDWRKCFWTGKKWLRLWSNPEVDFFIEIPEYEDTL